MSDAKLTDSVSDPLTPAPGGFMVLDHGYVRLVGAWGSDIEIVEAARMSTGKGFKGWGTPDAPGDEKLLRFLYTHAHMSPFEMAGFSVEVQAPIFVFREWHRHRTQSYNEMSARYAPLPDVNYVPTVDRLIEGAHVTGNRQAGALAAAPNLGTGTAEWFRSALTTRYAEQEKLYQDALQAGVPKELARLVLPMGRYSRMRAQANLRNWLQFLTLRLAPNAQWEIRQYARAVNRLVKVIYPRTHELFAEGCADAR